VDLDKYVHDVPTRERITTLNELSSGIKERALTIGMDSTEANRSGSFFQHDQSVVISKAAQEGLEIMDINDALDKYDWLQDYYFKMVQPDQDKFTAYSATHKVAGYFIRALPGAKIEFPLQACLYLGREGMVQNVHNVIIAEEGSELHIISGCTSDVHVTQGVHIGISEFYVKDNAKMTFTMIHNWAENLIVRPRSATRIGKNAVFMNNYVCMSPSRTSRCTPSSIMEGENSVGPL